MFFFLFLASWASMQKFESIDFLSPPPFFVLCISGRCEVVLGFRGKKKKTIPARLKDPKNVTEKVGANVFRNSSSLKRS